MYGQFPVFHSLIRHKHQQETNLDKKNLKQRKTNKK